MSTLSNAFPRQSDAIAVIVPGTSPLSITYTQLDHEIPWDHGPGAPPGQTRVDNLGPLSSFHHRLKTHGHWDVAEPFPGIHLWRDPHGHTYLRDATGTRHLGTQTEATVDPTYRTDEWWDLHDPDAWWHDPDLVEQHLAAA